MDKLVIADDNQSLAIGLQRFFRKKGFDVKTVFDGEELINLTQQEPIDLMIVDLRMPRVDGLSAIRAIKEFSPTTRVIIITGLGDSEDLSQATELGVSDFLTKPFSLDDIAESVRKVLKGSNGNGLKPVLHQRSKRNL